MLDINFIRENPEEVKRGVAKKMIDPKMVDKFLRLDAEWRAKVASLDKLKAEQNKVSEEISAEKNDHLLSRAQILKKRIAEVKAEKEELENKRKVILEALPNVPASDVPVGDASANRVLREVGEKPNFKFKPKDYLTIAENLGLINTKKAAAVAGSRFGYLLGDAVLLEFALVQFAFEKLVKAEFVPVVPPVFIRPEVFEGMGRLSKDQKEERYFLEKDNLYLVGSAEHTLGPIHLNDVLNEEDLPRRYAGFSTCFRREAGSYGKDTKGILRVHQFDKVEMFSFTKPEDSEKEFQFLLSLQEEMMQELALPYQVVYIASGDMDWAGLKQYDIETWLPASGEYRETHSATNTTDFQARGINAKYKTKDSRKDFVYMLNATAFAIGRTLIAIIENYQTAKGTILVPKVFQDYLGKKEIGK